LRKYLLDEDIPLRLHVAEGGGDKDADDAVFGGRLGFFLISHNPPPFMLFALFPFENGREKDFRVALIWMERIETDFL
jgi:hypothetical protein